MSVENKLADRRAHIRSGSADHVAKQREMGKQTAHERIDQLLDANSFVEWDLLVGGGVMTGFGTIAERPVYVYAQDYSHCAGAVGAAQAKKIVKVLDMALKAGAPVVALLDSAGAKLEEGAAVLQAYGEVYARHAQLSGSVPQIALVCGPCIGASAVIASLCDFTVMGGKGAQLLTAGPQVLLAKTGTDAKANAKEKQLERGLVDAAYEDEQSAIAAVRLILEALPANAQEDAPAEWMAEIPVSMGDVGDACTLAGAICDTPLFTLKATYAPEAMTALGTIGGRSAGILALCGTLHADALSKAARFVRVCDAFNLPVVTLVDVDGLDIEDALVTVAAAKMAYAYAEATTAKITFVTGNAIGAAAAILGLKASSDIIYAWPIAVIAPIAPQTAAAVLYAADVAASDDPVAAREACAKRYGEKCDALAAGEQGIVDDVIDPLETKKAIVQGLELLSGKRDVRPPKKHGNIAL